MALVDWQAVALDVDGTILNSSGELSPRLAQLIGVLQNKGIHIILATGRRPARTLPLARLLRLKDQIVAHNGAVIINPNTGKVVYKRGIRLEVARALIADLAAHDQQYTVYAGDDAGDTILIEERVWKRSQHLIRRFLDDDLAPGKDMRITTPPVKIQLLGPLREVESHLPRWQRQFGAEVTMTIFTSVEHQYMGVDFQAVGCTKASGVAYVLDQLGLSFAQVAAFGDESNDVELLKNAGLGVAMGNAQPHVKETADWVTATNDQDGVAVVLEELVLGRAQHGI